ncbi:efflux RND transporter periplasmic adaptor subunit [uncultured Desulfobacter sp.]|uniref:efflux RND transporter periplasmic adaptor subunit n=1 Tax=uncultured Desulfobacter sp. TaxID=240139 RepID=UPI002AAB5713|nr:efflux RND transporter periplasmic adaptor subunit [uncultured Desulfobacter sp.]
MPSFLFRLMRVAVVLLIAGGIAAWLFISREKPKKKEIEITVPKVLCVPAVAGSSEMTVEAFGTVAPRNSVKLAMEIAGRIDYVHPDFREGAGIQKNETLLRIDQRTLVLNEKTARVQVEQARADISLLEQEISNLKADAGIALSNLELASKELERMRALAKNQFASTNSLDKAEQQYLSAKDQLQKITNAQELIPSRMALKKSVLAAARTTLDQACLMLEKSQIRAPFDGFVMSKQVETGEFVNPGQVLGVIYEKDALDVEIRIPLEELQWLGSVFENGGQPQVHVIIANMEGSTSPVWPGHVARIKAAIDEKTRTMPMTVEIGTMGDDNGVKNPLLLLRPGIFVQCRVIGEQRENVFKIPRTLMRSPDTLYLARDSHLAIQKVKVIRRFEEDVYITTGLSPGDLIIASPLPGALDGMAIFVKKAGDNQ